MTTVRLVRQSHKSLFIKLYNYPNFSIGDIIEISISKENKLFAFIRKIIPYHKSCGINIPEFFVEKFDLHLGDKVEIVNINKLVPIKRSSEIFTNNKVDLLYLIPLVTRKNKEIYINIFRKNNEEWLRVWTARVKIQLELRRYIDIKMLGNLLGQIQAESPKFQNNRTPHIAFSNILINEHKDFIDSLRHMGISDDLFYVQCRYNHVKKEDVELKVKRFIEFTSIKVRVYLTKRKKGIEFDTYVMSSLLAEILLNSMDVIRRLSYTSDFNQPFKLLAENFVVKLLNGDGTIVITKCKRIIENKIENGTNIQGRICDKNSDYRKDYVQILRKLGVSSRDDNVSRVYFSCRLNNLLYLFKIGAFKGTPNWNKILYSIKLLTRGKTSHGKSLLRLTELPVYPFTLKSLKLNIGYHSLRLWAWKMKKFGYIKENRETLEITSKALDITEVFEDINKESKILNIS